MSDLRAAVVGTIKVLRETIADTIKVLCEMDDAINVLRETADTLEDALKPESAWSFPIGTEEFPPQDWYAALLHDPTGRRNGGWKHTGVDYNVDRWPWGDVDRGSPVWAIADGIVVRKAYSTNYLASIVISVAHESKPLYVRYWHLAKDAVYDALRVGMRFEAGFCLGHLGDYRMGGGGDHLHFDMALDPFEPLWWFTRHKYVRWIDPIPVLKAHLDPALVDASLRRD